MPFGPWPGGGGGGGGGAAVSSGLKVDPWRRADQLILPSSGWEVTTVAPTAKDNTDDEIFVAVFPDSGEKARGLSSEAPTVAVEGADATEFHISLLWKAKSAPSSDDVRWTLNYQVIRAGVALAGWSELDLGEITNSDDVLPNEAEISFTIGNGVGQFDALPGDKVYLQISRNNTLEGNNVVGDVHLIGVRCRWSAP